MVPEIRARRDCNNNEAMGGSDCTSRMEYLDRDDVLTAGSIAFGGELKVRDYGLLDAAVAGQATVFGVDAYPQARDKAAALLQSLARNHALVDGNKRTAWAAAWDFLHINGFELAGDFDVDRARDLMNDVATRDRGLSDIAASLTAFAVPRPAA